MLHLVFQNKPTKVTFHEIINKAMAKLEGWKANCLSKAGITVLIRSHMEAVPAHTMLCFRLPKTVTTNLDRINKEFFWKKSNMAKGLALVAWDRVCMPKHKGGLGLRKMDAINKAF